MSELANKIRNLRGNLSAEEAGEKCGVSRESFYRFERGGTTRLSTLKAIADGFGLNPKQWTDLLVSWLKLEAGNDVDRVWIEPREGGSAMQDADSNQVARAAMLFERLNPADRDEIFKAMQRPEVRACLPAINTVWEKFEAAKQLALPLPPRDASSTTRGSAHVDAGLAKLIPGAVAGPSPVAPPNPPPTVQSETSPAVATPSSKPNPPGARARPRKSSR